MHTFCRNIITEGFQINIVKEPKIPNGEHALYPLEYSCIFMHNGEEKEFYKNVTANDEKLREMFFNIEDGTMGARDIIKELKRAHNIL